jgi:hypothetical protein
MTGFSVVRFGGIQPVADPRKLPVGGAVKALDCDLQASDLRTFSPLKYLADVVSTDAINRSGFVFDETHMFIFANDVDATYGPIRAEEERDNRVFLSNGFKEFPTYSTKYLGLEQHGLDSVPYYGPPLDWRRLGVIAGPVKPIVSTSNAIGGTCELMAGSQTILKGGVNGPLSISPGPGDSIVTGTRLRITGLSSEGWLRVNNNVFVVSRESEDSTYYLGFLRLTALNTADLIEEGSVDADLFFDGDPGPFTYSDGCTWTQEFDVADVEDRYYVYTLVTELGEEGPPSLPSSLISVGRGQDVLVETPATITDPGAIYEFKRIYRTTPTSTGTADYYFVAEIPIGQALYTDSLDYIELGEQMQSLEWVRPPEGLTGLTVLPNGVMAGFVDRTLYLCEPYQPHAWPFAYTKNMDNPIVGIAAFGQQLVVGTEENPYIGTATDPLSMTFSKLQTVEPCISKRSIKSMGYGVIYPSPNGLIMVGPGGVKNVLNDIWDQKEWRALFRAYSDNFATVHDGKYYLTFFDLATKISDTLIFDPSTEGLMISAITQDSCSGMMVDRDEDRLYWLAARNQTVTQPGGAKVIEWNPDLDPESLEAKWTSQVFVMPMELSMAAMQVYYDRSWADPDATTQVDFIVDGVYRYTIIVTQDTPIRLPGGFLGLEWQLDVRTTRPIQAIFVAESIEELRGAFTR